MRILKLVLFTVVGIAVSTFITIAILLLCVIAAYAVTFVIVVSWGHEISELQCMKIFCVALCCVAVLMLKMCMNTMLSVFERVLKRFLCLVEDAPPPSGQGRSGPAK